MRNKSHFIYLCIVLILSCSKSDEPPSSKTHFEPPSWIIGVWEETTSNEANGAIYEFTSNNFIDRAWPGAPGGLDYNEFIYNSSFGSKIEERNSGTSYEIDLFITGDVPTTFWKFKKVSDNEINCWLKGGLVIAPVEFNLQKIN